jgi:hypothetical protein
MEAGNIKAIPQNAVSARLKKAMQTKRRASILETFVWVSDKSEINTAPLLTNPRDNWFLAEFEFYSFSNGSSKSIFFLSGFGNSKCWMLWSAQWSDQTGRYSAKMPIAGILKKDVEDSVAAGIVLFYEYLKSLRYEFSPDSITGSEIISEDELDQLISKASQLRG